MTVPVQFRHQVAAGIGGAGVHLPPAPSSLALFRAYAEPWMQTQFRQVVGQRLTPRSPYTRRYLIEVVCDVTGVSREDLLGPSRVYDIATARQLYYWLARRFTNCSLMTVAQGIDRCDHSTVFKALKHMEAVAATVTPDRVTDPVSWAEALWDARPMPKARPKQITFSVRDRCIWDDHKAGRTQRGIATKYGLARSTISRKIARLSKWAHLLDGQNPSDARAA